MVFIELTKDKPFPENSEVTCSVIQHERREGLLPRLKVKIFLPVAGLPLHHSIMKGEFKSCFMSQLTLKEREVLSLVSIGLTTKEIAGRLNISHHTVETHRKNLLRKCQAKNSAELILKNYITDSVHEKSQEQLYYT